MSLQYHREAGKIKTDQSTVYPAQAIVAECFQWSGIMLRDPWALPHRTLRMARGEGAGEDEEGKGGQTYGDGRLEFRGIS